MIYILSLSVNRRLLSDEICHQVGVFDVSCGNDVLRSDFLTLYCPNAKISVLLFAPVPAYFQGLWMWCLIPSGFSVLRLYIGVHYVDS